MMISSLPLKMVILNYRKQQSKKGALTSKVKYSLPLPLLPGARTIIQSGSLRIKEDNMTYHDQIINKILGQATIEVPELDQAALRNILILALADYSIEPMETALALQDNMREHIALYLASKQLDGLSPATLKNYKVTLTDFASTVRKNVKDITTMDIRAYLATIMRDRQVSAASADSYRSVIKSFFGWLMDEEMISKDPAHKLKPAKLPERERIALTDSELEILRDACKTLRERALVEIAFSTGCRVAELSGMDVGKINWSDQSIQVIGKGDKQRTVYFSGKAAVHLRKYLADRIFAGGPVWIASKKPHNRLSTRSLEREIEDIKDRIAIDKPVHPHILRHTFGTQAVRSGMPLQAIQELMGHSSVATTQVYAKTDKESLRTEHRKHMSI